MVHFGQPHYSLTKLLECYTYWFGDSRTFVKKGRKRTGPVGSVDVALAPLTAANGLILQLDPSDLSVFNASP